jgi:hypothetical protein
MTRLKQSSVTRDQKTAVAEAAAIFERAIGVSHIEGVVERVGNQQFLKFKVGRRAPIYDHAVRLTQKQLATTNPFKGMVSTEVVPVDRFPPSLEADVLGSMLTRNTRHVVSDQTTDELSISYVGFQNREDDKLTQAATHVLTGRRGVGKSTLITRATQILEKTPSVCVVLDMQAYSEASDESIFFDVVGDIAQRLYDGVREKFPSLLSSIQLKKLESFVEQCLNREIATAQIGPALRRILESIRKATAGDFYIFLDDYHVLDSSLQPRLLHLIHAGVKGAGGWIKVAGLKSLLNVYDPSTRQGLQIPGDAQLISLDLTLADPESAERHLEAILKKFLEAVGVQSIGTVIPENVLRRLVWANAGVPRDFLQMFGRSLEHARRSNRPKITFTDANLAIGEFGQQKIDDMERDARNKDAKLQQVLGFLGDFCLDENKVNAFLVRCENSPEHSVIQVLSDLRIVHLIHPTITPHRAGERYEAFLIDYCLFTGFRRRPNIKEMLPEDERQFKATELRKIPALPREFLKQIEPVSA